MAVKEASVRLEVKDSGFRRGVRGATASVKQGAKQMGGALRSSLSAGAKGGLGALKGMFSRIKKGFTSLAGLAGGIGMGALAKSAIDADTTFRRLAFTVSAGSGVIVDHNALMREAQALAEQWGVSTEKLAGAMETVFDVTGDLEFATLTLDDIARAARATGQEVEVIAPIVAEMNRQFGVTAEEVPEALASMLDLATRGGVSIGELGAGLGQMGKSAKLAGLSGVEGMKTMIGLINQFTAASGGASAATSNVDAVLRRLISDVAVMDKLKKEFKIDVVGEGLTGIEALKRLLQATQGDAAELGKIFTEKGGIIAAAFTGINDFDTAIAKAAETTLDAAGITKQANKNRKSAEAQVAIGIEKLKTAFTKPEIINALTQLAQTLPVLAEVVASIVKFTAETPVAAVGLGAGAVFAKGAIGAGVANLLAGGVKSGSKAGAGQLEAGVKRGSAAGGTMMAAAFMAAGVGAAVEQLSALQKEIGAKGVLDIPSKLKEAFQDIETRGKAEDIDLIIAGRAQGVQAQREARPGEFETTSQAIERFVTGGAAPQAFLTEERGLGGVTETVARATRTLQKEEGISAAVDAIIAAQSRQMMGLPAAPGRGGAVAGAAGGAAAAAQVGEQAAANAKALAGQLQQTQLKTRIENVDQLAVAIGNAMPKPQPKGSTEVP